MLFNLVAKELKLLRCGCMRLAFGRNRTIGLFEIGLLVASDVQILEDDWAKSRLDREHVLRLVRIVFDDLFNHRLEPSSPLRVLALRVNRIKPCDRIVSAIDLFPTSRIGRRTCNLKARLFRRRENRLEIAFDIACSKLVGLVHDDIQRPRPFHLVLKKGNVRALHDAILCRYRPNQMIRLTQMLSCLLLVRIAGLASDFRTVFVRVRLRIAGSVKEGNVLPAHGWGLDLQQL